MSLVNDEVILRETAERVYPFMSAEHSSLSEQISGVNVDNEPRGMTIDAWNWTLVSI